MGDLGSSVRARCYSISDSLLYIRQISFRFRALCSYRLHPFFFCSVSSLFLVFSFSFQYPCHLAGHHPCGIPSHHIAPSKSCVPPLTLLQVKMRTSAAGHPNILYFSFLPTTFQALSIGARQLGPQGVSTHQLWMFSTTARVRRLRFGRISNSPVP